MIANKKNKIQSIESGESYILETLKNHSIWIQTSGKKGVKAIFMHANLSGFDFSNLDLSQAVFKNCDLSFTKFGKNILENIDFYGSNLSGTIFLNKKLININFEKAQLSGLKASEVDFISCNFNLIESKNVDIIKCKITKCNITNCHFFSCNFNFSEFVESKLEKTIFTLCDCSYLLVINCKLLETSFLGDELHCANFISSTIKHSHFKSFVEENNSQKINTILNMTKFNDCIIQDCFFEEDKKSLTKKFITSKYFSKKINKHSNIKKVENKMKIASLASFSITLASILYLPFAISIYGLSSTLLLGFASVIFVASNFYITLIYFYKKLINNIKANNVKIAKKQNNLINKIIPNKIAGLLHIKLLFLPSSIMGLFWVYSLFFENFTFAFLHLVLFFYSFSTSFFIIKKFKF